ncbi:MAG TPA: hypothetical protein VFO81_02945 [Gaiellaceae bacterium]|nr:hypothetical protein [Gaiellaceae bacterium]
MERELAGEAAGLYGLPADEFTAARNARAKELRGEQPELAAAVAKLPKPTAAAAAVNRLAREEPSEVRALVQAGRRLREAQEAALSGAGENDVAAATREHRDALERVRREARRLRLSDAVLERVTSTLRAASVDPALQPLLERGLLAREVESAGFGLDPALAAARPRRSSQNIGRRGRGDDQEEPAAAARAGFEAAQARLATAKREAKAAEGERRRIARQLEGAEAGAERAQRELEAAERAVEEARAEVARTRAGRRR